MQSILANSKSAAEPAIRAQYPSYVSLDEFIDLERLRSLDAYLRDRIARRILTDADDFFVNQHCLDKTAPYRPGVREVWLTRTAPGTPYDYLNINRCELWQRTPDASDFTLLMSFIDDLPFEATGRILLIYDRGDNAVLIAASYRQSSQASGFGRPI